MGFSNPGASDGCPPAVCWTNMSSPLVSIAAQHLTLFICVADGMSHRVYKCRSHAAGSNLVKVSPG